MHTLRELQLTLRSMIQKIFPHSAREKLFMPGGAGVKPHVVISGRFGETGIVPRRDIYISIAETSPDRPALLLAASTPPLQSGSRWAACREAAQ